jgi:hypothetical protein
MVVETLHVFTERGEPCLAKCIYREKRRNTEWMMAVVSCSVGGRCLLLLLLINQGRVQHYCLTFRQSTIAGFDIIYKSSTDRHDRQGLEDTRQGPFSRGLTTNLAGMSLATVGPWILLMSHLGSLAQFDASNGTLIACNADVLVSSGPHGRLLGKLAALQE